MHNRGRSCQQFQEDTRGQCTSYQTMVHQIVPNKPSCVRRGLNTTDVSTTALNDIYHEHEQNSRAVTGLIYGEASDQRLLQSSHIAFKTHLCTAYALLQLASTNWPALCCRQCFTITWLLLLQEYHWTPSSCCCMSLLQALLLLLLSLSLLLLFIPQQPGW